MKQWCLDDFAQLLDLLFASTNITVGHIGFVLDLHHGDSWIDLGRQRDVNLVFVAINTEHNTEQISVNYSIVCLN